MGEFRGMVLMSWDKHISLVIVTSIDYYVVIMSIFVWDSIKCNRNVKSDLLKSFQHLFEIYHSFMIWTLFKYGIKNKASVVSYTTASVKDMEGAIGVG